MHFCLGYPKQNINFKIYLKVKKLIFSAIAMMAFVGTSFATSGEVEVKNKIEQVYLFTVYDSVQGCGAVAEFGAMNAERHYSATHCGDCLSDASYNAIYMMYLELCMQ